MSNRLVKLLPLTAALALSSLASAETIVDPPSLVVKYEDLNLDTRSGVSRLHARLRSAAKKVCSPLDGSVVAKQGMYDACVTEAVARSVAKVGNANLTQYHRYGSIETRTAAN